MQLVRSWANSSSSIHRVRPANSHWRGNLGEAAGWRLLAKLKDSGGGGGEGEREMVLDGSGLLAVVALLDRPDAAAAAVLVVVVEVVDSLSSSK